jgi:hypothetical protein
MRGSVSGDDEATEMLVGPLRHVVPRVLQVTAAPLRSFVVRWLGVVVVAVITPLVSFPGSMLTVCWAVRCARTCLVT